jgi:hypothetical protein
VVEPEEKRETPFNYIDTASSRAEIDVVTTKLKKLNRIAIVGLGGTGSYVLDFVAKTPVWEIHLYDGDDYLQHNAFRAPGTPSLTELQEAIKKATWFKNIYSKMHSGVIDHPVYIDESNIGELRGMAFAFLCVDDGESKKLIVEKLEQFGIPFVDVGMGMRLTDGDMLAGAVRVTASTPAKRDHFRCRVSFQDLGNNEYNRNMLAVGTTHGAELGTADRLTYCLSNKLRPFPFIRRCHPVKRHQGLLVKLDQQRLHIFLLYRKTISSADGVACCAEHSFVQR